MAVVKMHKASDGTLHESFDAFAKHEERLKIMPELDKAIEACDFSASEHGVIREFTLNNADKLREILNGAVVSKRGRKAA